MALFAPAADAAPCRCAPCWCRQWRVQACRASHSKDRAVLASLLIFLGLGVVAGVLAGLLGVGGGLVLVAALAWLLPTMGVPQEAAMHAALASSLASIVLTAAASARA